MHAATLRRPAAALAIAVFALFAAPSVAIAVDETATAEPLLVSAAPASDKQTLWGQQLFNEGCASCHGLKGEGSADTPPLPNVGAAGAHFEITTGRMPIATIANQAIRRAHSMYTEAEARAIAKWVATLGDGPGIPTEAQVKWQNADLAMGGEVFRTNCAQCHSFSGQGGALTVGKAAPNLLKATPIQVYEAMLVGPNNMPMFSDATLPPAEKQAVIKYIEFLKQPTNPGGLDLGRLGPVSEGLYGWVFGFGLLVVVAIWIGVKAK
jgi:ubiquinol-cytochrome c reductase cytochrome c subunit